MPRVAALITAFAMVVLPALTPITTTAQASPSHTRSTSLADLPAPLPAGPFAGAIDVTLNNHAAVLEASKSRLILMDFSKETCGPCVELAPRLRAKMGADKDWTWGVANSGTQKDLWSLYGRPWNPTLIALRNGDEVARHVGYRSDWKGLAAWIDEARAGKTPPSHEVQIDLTSDRAVQRIQRISTSKPVLLRFHQESVVDSTYEQRIKLWEKAEADNGSWMLANVDIATEQGRTLARTFNTKPESALTVYYQGRTWQKLLPSHYGYTLNDATLTRFVTAMLKTSYDPTTPPDTTPVRAR